MEQIIKIKNLSFSYDLSNVLDNVSFSVDRGDYVAIAGPNGAGKTTLVKAILNLLGDFSGEISIFNEDNKNFKDWYKIGYLSQKTNSFNPIFPATVSEVVSLGLIANKKYPKIFDGEDKRKIESVLKELNIFDLKDKQISKISGGQQQRVFLARAMVSSPEILFLDEPSSALDPKMRQEFFDILNKLNKEKNITIILITHDTSSVANFSNKLLYVDKTLIFYGSYGDFCKSENMSDYFGHFSQHLICHQHKD
jgi:zinc transport system ATP-binding protein